MTPADCVRQVTPAERVPQVTSGDCVPQMTSADRVPQVTSGGCVPASLFTSTELIRWSSKVVAAAGLCLTISESGTSVRVTPRVSPPPV